jgi:hypothetical protein
VSKQVLICDFDGDSGSGHYFFPDLLTEELTFMLSSKSDGEELITILQKRFERHKILTLSELFDYTGLETNHKHAKYGWVDLSEVKIIEQDGKYLIEFPKPELLSALVTEKAYEDGRREMSEEIARRFELLEDIPFYPKDAADLAREVVCPACGELDNDQCRRSWHRARQ